MNNPKFNNFIDRYKLRLDDAQKEAVTAVDGPVLILAVPGSGKTTVLVSRLGYMVYECGINPDSILTVTYTVAATEDMRRRFKSYFGEEYASSLEFRTINGISQKILTFYGVASGKKPYALADKEIGSIIREAIRSVNGGFPTDNDISNAQTAISYAKNMCLSDEAIKKQKVEIENFYDIYTTYNQILKDRCLIDYDDQMVYALKILKGVPDILKYFQDQYKYILVDEAQDTSFIQHKIIELLAAKSGNLFMVGDEDQSIYGFRAAYPKALLDFPKKHKGAKVLFLENNYRSGKDIVAAADLVISKNVNRYQKTMNAARDELGKVSRLDTKRRKNQYQYIADRAKEIGVQTAILYRNNESALPLIDILERNKVYYRLKNADISFFSHPVINDIKDFYSLAINPSDDEAFMRIYYKMGVGISKILAQGAVYNCGSEGMLAYIAKQESVSPAMSRRIESLISDFAMLKKEDASLALKRILEKMGYAKYMDSRSLDTNKIDILNMLSAQVKNLGELFLRLDDLANLISKGNENYDAKLTLSTIHSAKGLEYERVYMLDMAANVIPSVKKPGRYATKEQIDAYEEERRLFYVGITRAKNELYIFTYDYDSTSEFSIELFSIEKPKDPIEGTNYIKKSGPLLRTNYGKARPR